MQELWVQTNPDSAPEQYRVYQSTSGDPERIGLSSAPADGTRYTPILDLGEPAGTAGWIFVVGIELEPGHEDDFEAWYNTEHLPALANVPGVNRAVRYRRGTETGATEDYPEYLAIYEVASPDIPGNADWKAAVETPWTVRLRPHFTARWRGGYQLSQ